MGQPDLFLFIFFLFKHKFCRKNCSGIRTRKASTLTTWPQPRPIVQWLDPLSFYLNFINVHFGLITFFSEHSSFARFSHSYSLSLSLSLLLGLEPGVLPFKFALPIPLVECWCCRTNFHCYTWSEIEKLIKPSCHTDRKWGFQTYSD